MKSTEKKKDYKVPVIEQIYIDNEISLILSSTPADPWTTDSNYEPNNPFKFET
jgi:hypothetical protein